MSARSGKSVVADSAGVVEAPFVRSPYNYDVEAASNETAVGPGGPSLTVQSMAEDADINVLMRRYGITGKMPENPRIPSYGDYEGITDYQSALNAVMDGQQKFFELTAEVRARFENNPQLLLEFMENAANLEEARKLGLVGPAAPAPGPVKVEIVGPAVVQANVTPGLEVKK